jgi:pyruvate kinase
MKKTKIVATIGPACEQQAVIKQMALSGMNVCRLNFSHGDYDWHKKVIQRVRRVEKQIRKKIGIMADIQGPRVRVANRSVVSVKEGEVIFLTDGHGWHDRGHKKDLVLDWKGFYEYLKRGDKVYIEDGMIQLEIMKRIVHGCSAKVLVGGKLKPHKGVNIPSISKHMGFLTEKDFDDLDFILSQDVDFIAVSFVANKQDLIGLKQLIKQVLKKKNIEDEEKIPWIISKVERKKALKNIADVIKYSDGIMVARGDLAIEMPQEKLGVYQKDIVKRCLRARKPVIVATQMMASMIKNARPTRAEISDVTNAVVDNADAVMLSNESAIGAYPVEAISTMSKIIKSTEDSPYNDVKLKKYGKLGKLLFSKKRRKQSVMRVKTIAEARKVASLRQEDIKTTLTSRKPGEKRKVTLVWGAE